MAFFLNFAYFLFIIRALALSTQTLSWKKYFKLLLFKLVQKTKFYGFMVMYKLCKV